MCKHDVTLGNRGLLLKCGEMLWPKAEATSSEFAKKGGTSATMPSPSPISVICFGKECMIQFFRRSHTKTPESGHFSDWIGNNTEDFCYSD